MELLHLKYFLTVAKTEHITKAAKELNIVQPALSKTISSLEKEICVSLFDRKGKYIELNENGRFFYEKVNQSLSILENSIKELQEKNSVLENEIKLLVLAASPLIPDILSKFRSLYPQITFELSQDLESPSNCRNFDFYIYSAPNINELDKNSINLLTEELSVAVPISHPLAKKSKVSLHDLYLENFITLGQGNFKEVVYSILKSGKFTPNIVFESNNPFTLKNLISSGQGISIVPSMSWNFKDDPYIKLLSFDNNTYKRNVNLSWNEAKYKSNHILLFKEFIMDYFENIR